MTLRSALLAVRTRWWIVLLTVIAASAAATLYQVQSTPTYTSTATMRLNAGASAAVSEGVIGGVPVDVDPTLISSRAVLDPAAQSLGETYTQLSGAVTWTVPPAEFATTLIDVTAVGDSALQAQERAAAVVESYGDLVSEQFSSAESSIETQIDAARQSAADAQEQLSDDPGNVALLTALSDELARLSVLNGQLAELGGLGTPVTTLVEPLPGSAPVLGLAAVVALAVVSGLVVGIAVALLLDSFDDRLRRESDVVDVAQKPNLGSLGFNRQAHREANRLPAAASARSPIEESLRALRTTLQVMLPNDGASLVVTSVAPGDGKSFLAANLAVAWGRMGKSIVLVDGDLRRPTVATYFPEVVAAAGISDLLSADPADGARPSPTALLSPTRHTGVRVLTAGSQLSDPADLLGRPAFADVLAELKTVADVVIIDSPPSLGLTDAALMGAHTDGVVLMVTHRRTRRRHLDDTLAALSRQGADVLGTVINRARDRIPASYSSYYYTEGAKGGTKGVASRGVDTGRVDARRGHRRAQRS